MVQLYPNGPKTHSDKNGFFTFRKSDLSKYHSILYGKNQQYRLVGFQNQIKLIQIEPTKKQAIYKTKQIKSYVKNQSKSDVMIHLQY
jgi:hypothetical protein